jgi:hypothetical protein
MKKILLIEDRKERQQKFMNETMIDLNSYSDILDNNIGGKYEETFDKLKNDTFNFDNYSIIISHKSAYSDENASILNKIEQHCKKQQIPLVLFSGGVDVNYYLNEENFEHIEVNSKTFYSQNIQLFLDDFRNGNMHPLIFCYGAKWKLNIILNILEKINNILEETDSELIFYKRFVQSSSVDLLESLELNLYEPILDGNKIHKDEIIKIRDCIMGHVNESVKYE